jgi:alpha/beta hydrolase fold
VIVTSVEYQLAPKHLTPDAALEGTLAAARWATEHSLALGAAIDFCGMLLVSWQPYNSREVQCNILRVVGRFWRFVGG